MYGVALECEQNSVDNECPEWKPIASMAKHCVTAGLMVIPIASMAEYCVIQGCITIPNIPRASQLSSSLTLSRDNGCYTM